MDMLRTGKRGQVERRRSLPVGRQPRSQRPDVVVQLRFDPRVGLACLAVDAGDGGTGDDVVELVEQHVAPVLGQGLPAVLPTITASASELWSRRSITRLPRFMSAWVV